MSKLSHKVRHDLRLSVSDRMELADALDAMESALMATVQQLEILLPKVGRVHDERMALMRAQEALAKLEGK